MRGKPAVAEASVTFQQPEEHHVFSQDVVPGSRDPGSGRLPRLLEGEVWIVTCVCSQASWWWQQQPYHLIPVSGV